ncbi:probable serine/threonine-protein kinase DDB_G0281745 [Trichogramma pretiosum]|uniref:probable serine/threonine-protein kinase DDB_G0281745 n=1 Tax=Trichogramma pretiosum TaxID=7493 RepID=UPI000C71C3BA|nr:probable serine/threonine-protein kinase DDB_G0281745 [Trichogramma pretiosum]
MGWEDTPATLSQVQKVKLHSIMKCIQTQEAPVKQQEVQKRKKISSKPANGTPILPLPSNQVKKMNVFWLHRDIGSEQFYKMNGVKSKEIQVDSAINYSVKDITTLCIAAHKDEFNVNYFQKSETKIGRKDFNLIEDFGSDGFWGYYKAAYAKAHRPICLYLYTIANQPKSSNQVTSVAVQSESSSTQSKENSSLFLNALPSCQSIFKTPALTNEIPVSMKSKIKETDIEAHLVSNKKQKISIEDVDDVKAGIAVAVPIDFLKFTDTILGKGAFGEVRRGFWCESEVAIKTSDLFQQTPKQIIKEIAILGRVRHSNIVSLMGYSRNDNEFHIIMDFIDGYSLHDLIFKQNVKIKMPLEEQDKVKLTYQILLGIAFLHQFPHQILHRDIKPANVMVTKNKFVKICDLGVSKLKQLSTELLTTRGHTNCVGIPLYMTPELFLDFQEATEYSDIWSLGCTLIEMYSENRVWQLESISNLKEVLKRRCKPSMLSVPEFLQEIISTSFNYDVNSRPKALKILQVLKQSGVELKLN